MRAQELSTGAAIAVLMAERISSNDQDAMREFAESALKLGEASGVKTSGNLIAVVRLLGRA